MAQATAYQYNTIGQETGESWYSTADTSSTAAETISYACNSAGELQSATDQVYTGSAVALTDSYTYDLAGEVLTDKGGHSRPHGGGHFERDLHRREPHAACGL